MAAFASVEGGTVTKVLSDYLQWERHLLGTGVVALSNGGFMRCYRLLPPSLEHADDATRLGTAEKQSDSFRRLRDSYGLHFEEVFMDADGYSPPAEWPTQASALLDAERERACRALGKQLDGRQYLTITSKPKHPTQGWLAKWFVTSEKQAARDFEREVQEFHRTCKDIESSLAGAVSMRELSDNETSRYLHFTVTHRWEPVKASAHEDIGLQLGVEPFDPALGVGKLGKHYVQLVVLSGFDNGTKPQMLEGLDVRFPYRRIARWLPIERGEALAMLRSRQTNAGMEEEGAREAILKGFDHKHQPRESMRDATAEKAAQAARSAAANLDRRGHGLLSNTFVVWDESRSACRDKMQALRKEIAGAGIVAKSELLATWGTWLGTLPGHLDSGVRKAPMTTRHLADLVPSTRRWPGEMYDKAMAKKTGIKRPWMYIADPKPFRLTTDVDGGASNVAVFGATGSGKSTFVNNLALQYFANPEAQVISISYGRSELGPCLLSGGAVYSIGSHKSPLAFQPLAHIDQPAERQFAAEWLTLCLTASGRTATDADRAALQEALDLRASDPQKMRTITLLRRDLKSRAPDVYKALADFSREGMYGHIFDGDQAGALGWRPWTMFDISHILAKTVPDWVVEASVSLLMHVVQSRFNGQPTLMVCDEYPRYLKHESIRSNLLVSTLDTQRKNHVRMVLAAQNPQQLADYHDLVASVQGACFARIYGADTSAQTEFGAETYRKWGLGPNEIGTIGRLKKGHFLYKAYRGDAVRTRTFDYAPGPLALALTGMSEPDELDLLTSLHEQTKGDPDRMLHELIKARGLELKAKELEKWQQTKKRVA